MAMTQGLSGRRSVAGKLETDASSKESVSSRQSAEAACGGGEGGGKVNASRVW